MGNEEFLKQWGIIHSQLKVEDVFTELGISYKPVSTSYGEELLLCCPFHMEKTPSFYYSTSNHVYKCWGSSCKRQGRGFIKIYAHVKGIRYEDAVQQLFARCDGGLENITFNTAKKVSKPKPKQEIKIELPRGYKLIDYDNDNFYWKYLSARGLTKQLTDFYLLGYCDFGYYAGRVIIPVESNNRVVGFLARRIFDDKRPDAKEYFDSLMAGYEKKTNKEHSGKGKKVLYPKGFSVTNYLYNYDNIDRKKPLIVVEGVFDCWAVRNAGYDNVVANFGTHISDVNIKKYYNFPELWVIPDKNDASGYALWEELKEKGANRKIYLVEIPAGYDPAETENLGQYIENRRMGTFVRRKYFVRTVKK